jgi:hypothetical protein
MLVLDNDILLELVIIVTSPFDIGCLCFTFYWTVIVYISCCQVPQPEFVGLQTASTLPPSDMSTPCRTTQQTPSPLSPFQFEGVLTDEQWTTLASVVDTIISPVTQPTGVARSDREAHFKAAVATIKHNTGVEDDVLISAYLAESATSCPEFRESIIRFLATHVNDAGRKSLLSVLDALT